MKPERVTVYVIPKDPNAAPIVEFRSLEPGSHRRFQDDFQGRGIRFVTPKNRRLLPPLPRPDPVKFLIKLLVGVVALIVIIFTAVTAFAQDTCSGRKAACDNVCWQRSGSAQIECNDYCKRQMASCLKTGVFKTRGGDYSGLKKK